MVLNGSSSISGNRTDIWGGRVYNSGTLILNRSSAIRGNTAGATGGGVYNDVLSTLKMNGSSSISGNTASGYDGGEISTWARSAAASCVLATSMTTARTIAHRRPSFFLATTATGMFFASPWH